MSDPLLVKFLVTGKAACFTEWMHASRQQVFNTARRVCHDASLAEDISQEVFERLYREPPSVEEVRSPGKFLTGWVVKVARTRMRSEARRRARAVLRARDQAASLLPGTFTPEQIRELNNAIATLPPPLARVVELRYFGGLRITEVAEALSIDCRTVTNRVNQALDRLRRTLAPTMAVFVASALGQPADSALPMVAIPARLASRLDRLIVDAQTPLRPTRTPRAPGPRPALIASSGAAVILLGTLGLTWLRSPGSPRALPTTIAVDTPDGTAIATAFLPPPSPGAGVGDNSASSSSFEPAGQKARRAAGPQSRAKRNTSPDASPGLARLELQVVDEAGEPVRAGTVTLEAQPQNDFQRGLRQVAMALGMPATLPRRSLADTNPIALDIPPAFHGVQIAIQVDAPGFVGHRASSITARPGSTARVSVTLLAALSVTVQVRNARTDEPVEGALIEVDDDPLSMPRELEALVARLGTPRRPAGRTSAAGKVELPGVRQRLLTVSASATGFKKIHAVEVPAEETVILWLHELDPRVGKGSLTVRVFDLDGRPWARCPLRFQGDPADAGPRLTDAAGEHRIENLAPGLQLVGLLEPKLDLKLGREKVSEALELAQTVFLYRTAIVTVEAGKDLEVVLRAAVKSGRACIRVVDEAGRPCVRVAVELYSRTTAASVPPAETDSRGDAVLVELEPGNHSIRVKLKEARITLGEVDVIAGAEARAQVTLGAGVIAGEIVDEDGSPVEAIIACLAPGHIEAGTDKLGRFEIAGLLPGEHRLAIAPRDDELVPTTQAVPVVAGTRGTSSDVFVRVHRGGRATVLVASSGGGTVPGATVRRREPAGKVETLYEMHRGRREAEFRCAAALDAGEHVFVVEAPDCRTEEVRARIKVGEETVVRVEMEPVNAEEGTVKEKNEAEGTER